MKNHRSIDQTIYFVIILSLCFCAIGFSGNDTDSYGAFYHYKKWECRVEKDKLRIKESAKITITNARGEENGDLWFYESSLFKLKKVSITIFDSDGNKANEFNKGDLTKTCGYGSYSLYQDICWYTTTLGTNQYPYTIEYEQELESGSLYFWSNAVFQESIPVKYASYRLKIANDVTFFHKMYDLQIKPEITPTGEGKTVYKWKMENIPALDDIDYAPPGYNLPGRIVFAADQFKLDEYQLERCDWYNIGKWYIELASDRYLPDSVDFQIDTTMDKLSKAKSIFDEVIEDIRYVAIEIGIGGFQPHKAEMTQSLGYGDCKDMATLLVSKLRQQEIMAYPCRVLTRGAGRTDIDFPVRRFNHAIAVTIIYGDTIWMDATSNYHCFGEIPGSIEDVNILVIDDEGGKIRRTPPSKCTDNLKLRFTEIEIEADFNYKIICRMLVTGNIAAYYRSKLDGIDNDQKQNFIKRRFPGSDKTFKIASYAIENLKDICKPLIINIEAQSIKPFRKIGNKLYINPYPFYTAAGVESEDLDERSIPLYLGYPDMIVDSVTIRWTAEIDVDSIVLPKNDSLSFTFGGIKTDSEIRDGIIFINTQKSYFDYEIDPVEFENFTVFRKKIKEIYSQHIKLLE